MDDERMSEPARRRAAHYARQPSLWPAPSPGQPEQPRRSGDRGPVIRIAVAAVILLGGPPVLLWQVFGDPVSVASSWWTTDPFSATTTSSPAAGLRVAGIWAGWLAWALLATLLVGSIVGVLGGRRLPRWRLPLPLHRLVFGLTGTATVALVATPAAAAIAAPATQATLSPQVEQTNPTARPDESAPAPMPSGEDPNTVGAATAAGDLVTVAVDAARYDYRVRKGDTLSKVARTWLGDPNRWPDICELNKHRHFTGGRTLTDCDLIYPGWELRLPADAAPPPHATPTRPPSRPTEPSARPHPERSSAPTTNPAPSPSQPAATPDSSAEATPATPGQADNRPTRSGDDLVLPGGSIIPWALAAAITATAALVWMQRRRRFNPGTIASPDTSDGQHQLPPLPAPVRAAQHHTAGAVAVLESTDGQWLPSGGVGLVGSGADAAARGMIITALTAGTPTEPSQRAEVIIDRRTLAALIGDTPITGYPRLHITDTLDQSLTLIDTHLLHRARILDEHNLTDLDTMRDAAPSEEALPPLLLITDTEQATPSTRARITFGLTQGLDVTTVVLGHWPHGSTISVTDDGDARTDPETAAEPLRLAVLDTATARDLLDTAREAHTGEFPPVTAAPTPAPTTFTAASTTTTGTGDAPAQLAGSRDTGTAGSAVPTVKKRARLRVLGTPQIEDVTAEGRPLRAKALELAVFLAVHPDGATTRDIGEYLEPDARISQADQRVHTNASNLRHVLGRAGTADPKNAYVIKTAGRYRLDPATVDVDVWTLRNLMRDAAIATQPRRRELLTTACNLSSAPLAHGKDYEWIQPHREAVRRWSTEAHLMLADDLLDNDPQAASDLLDKAISHDRYNEALYTKAMHARHALGDTDGIRILLRALTKALADLDAEPQEHTITLATELRNSLNDG